VRALAALAIVVAGAIGAFAVYTFGWRDDGEPTPKPGARTYTVSWGDVVVVPGAATRCQASGEGGFPNLFCEGTPRSRYQVVIFSDVAQLYDLEAGGEPLDPTYSVPRKPSR
jgi:hypothetical protein